MAELKNTKGSVSSIPIALIIGAVGAILGIVSVFMPPVKGPYGLGLAEPLMAPSQMFLGIIPIVLIAAAMVFIFIRKKIGAIILAALNVVYTGFIVYFLSYAKDDLSSYADIRFDIGFYFMIAGAVILLVGSVFTKKKQ